MGEFMGICHEAYILANADKGLLETPGDGNNPKILLMHSCTTLKATEDKIPWCSSAMNYWICLANIKRDPLLMDDALRRKGLSPDERKQLFAAVGIDPKGTRQLSSFKRLIEPTWSAAAASWLRWGQTSIGEPIEGDIVVFEREGGSGHVGFFVEWDRKGRIVCLGGNQHNMVCEAVFPKERLRDFRRM